ncbi:MAG TPA: DUF58 domain-containing protein, partial [Acidimicrobiales bacterium]|nr:DUF58 domain-containing protein [Acidimicrobiales bacterium]
VTCAARPATVYAGEPAHADLVVVNRAMAQSPALVVKSSRPARGTEPLLLPEVALPRLNAGEAARLVLMLDTSRRGVYELAGLEAVIEDPLGLARRSPKLGGEARLTVFPPVDNLADLIPFAGWNPRYESTRSTVSRLGSGLSSFRKYSDGDDLRLVHWKTSARVGELVVREGGEPEAPESQSTTVVLDTRRSSHTEATFEQAVYAATSVLDSGFAVGSTARLVTTIGHDVRASSDDPWQFEELLVELARVHPTRETSLETAAHAIELDNEPGVLVYVTASLDDTGVDHVLGGRGNRIIVVTGDGARGPKSHDGIPVVYAPPGVQVRPAWAAALDPGRLAEAARHVRRASRDSEPAGVA